MSSTALPSATRLTRPARSPMNVSPVPGRTAITIGASYEPASANVTFSPSTLGTTGAVVAGDDDVDGAVVVATVAAEVVAGLLVPDADVLAEADVFVASTAL